MINYKQIEKQTLEILNEYGITKIPVPVESIAKKMGLSILAYDMGEDVSGALVIQNNKGTIGFNPHESKVRQRFTIAHEFGHYVLHKNEETDLFIDKDFKVLFRNSNSSLGKYKHEQEANTFAAALLMPEKFLSAEIKKLSFNIADDESLKFLAKRFNVSVAAMTLRISNLNLFMRL